MKGDGVLSAGGGCDPLGIKPADFMLNKPAWLGDAPRSDRYRGYRGVRRAGHRRRQRGHHLRASLPGGGRIGDPSPRCKRTTSTTSTPATWPATTRSSSWTKARPKLTLPKYSTSTCVSRAAMRIRRSCAITLRAPARWLDWLTGHIPTEYVEKYAKTSNYKGNENFNGECCGQKILAGHDAVARRGNQHQHVAFRHPLTVHTAFEEAGGAIKWGYQGVRARAGRGTR